MTLIRDHQGDFKGAVSTPNLFGISYLAELCAIKLGLALVVHKHCLKDLLEMDSQIIYRWLLQDHPDITFELHTIWKDIPN